jgi:ribosome biogenesis GTPase
VQIATCGIQPVILLNKSDLVDDMGLYKEQVNRLQRDVPIFFCSVKTGEGMETLKENVFRPGITSVLIGSSGVGKSSLINELTNSCAKTNEVSEATGKGKHTTTTRDMFLLDNGSVVIDTPGMREFGVGVEDLSGFDKQFPAIGKFAEKCRYGNCKHLNENGCNVIKAYNEGWLDAVVYESYIKLQKEQEHFLLTTHQKKKQGKQFGKMVREAKEYRKRYKY